MIIRRIVILLATTGLLAACGGGSKSTEGDQEVTEQSMEAKESEAMAESEPAETPETSAETMGGGMGPMMDMCPMHAEGTTMTMEQTADGMAMTFTNADDAEEVQKRAMKMAEHHPMAMERHGSPLPAFDVEAEATETGARMMMTPRDSAQMEAFQAAVQERFDAQGEKQCPMMMMYDKMSKQKRKGMKSGGS